jgi:hypothetical protein
MTIISFFFIGGVVGGICYTKIQLKVLVIASLALIVGLIYDNIKLKIVLLNRKYHSER